MSEQSELMKRSEDETLVRDHLAGRSDAFRALYEKYRDRVYSLAYRITGDAEEAADLVQEIFVKIHRELSRFRFQSRFSTWLFRVAVNHAINRANRRSRHARIHEKIARIEGGTLHEKGGQATRAFDEDVARAVGALGTKLRSVVALRYQEGLSYEEISGVLGVSIGTVKSRLFLAHETLRPLLQKTAARE